MTIMLDKAEILRGAQIELARREFWWFCKLMAPDFYKENRPFLKDLCYQLQDFDAGNDKVMVVNMPPRHGKSRTAGLFEGWLLGRNRSEKIMTGSYNEELSTTFAKSVRNTIAMVKGDRNRIVYADIFPETRIKRGDGAMNLWSLEGGYNNFLATSPTGTATGFGADLIVIDDLIKNNMEAYNVRHLEKLWEWFTNTMFSRQEEGAKMLIIMTRWHSLDIAGRVLARFAEGNVPVRHVCYKAVQDDGSMLCPEILSAESYRFIVKEMSAPIASANYQQEPIDMKGRLYSSFSTYKQLPTDENGNTLLTATRNYTDTADEGTDFLCSICYGVYNGEVYVLDVLYTDDPMEITEPAMAEMLIRNDVRVAWIESNNGGRGFARAVQAELRKRESKRCDVGWFFQSKNKKARILSNATWVMNHIHFPVNWRDKWPEYYDAMIRYQSKGENDHDDAPDATTGVAEVESQGSGFSF